MRQVSVAALVDNNSTAEARQLLAARRQASPSYRDPTTKLSRHIKSKSKLAKQLDQSVWIYTRPELDAALQDAIDGDRPLSIIAALLQLGAQINLNKALARATSAWDNELVYLLLDNRGTHDIQVLPDISLEIALNISLEIALRNLASNASSELDANQTEVVSALVAVGAKFRVRSLHNVISQG